MLVAIQVIWRAHMNISVIIKVIRDFRALLNGHVVLPPPAPNYVDY